MHEQLTDELLAYEADYLWINENIDILLEKYLNQWIAVKSGQKNNDSETRINSAKSLTEIGDKRAIEPLKSALAEENDEDVKKAFEEAIGKLEK